MRSLVIGAGEGELYAESEIEVAGGLQRVDQFFGIERRAGNIIVASPCSGHGFKFASVVGEILADLAADGQTALPISAFSFAALTRRAKALKETA